MNKFIIILIAVFSPFFAEAANLHAVIIADTTDESIGDSTYADLYLMKREVEKIADQTDLDLKPTIFEGTEVVTSNVLDKLEQLDIQEEDTVIFYFSGHGYRTDSKGDSPWPNLFFSREEKGISYEHVVEKLEAYNPRFLLVIADACNSLIPEDYAPPLVRKWFFRRISKEEIKENYRSLFLNVKGTVFVTSSKAGQSSWGTAWGGLFSVRFIANLNSEVKGSTTATWQSILEKTYEDIQEDQNPDFRIDVEAA